MLALLKNRLLCFGVVLCFFISQNTTATDLHDRSHFDTNKKDQIRLPESIGTVSETFNGTSSQSVIHIRDIHCFKDAQLSIAEIVAYLNKTRNISLVLAEGAIGTVDTSLFGSFPDSNVKKEVMNHYLEKGILTGPEYLSIMRYPALPLLIHGIENEQLYRGNFTAYADVMAVREKADLFLESAQMSIQVLKEKIFSPELFQHDFTIRSYHDGTLGLQKFCSYLVNSIHKHGLENYKENYVNVLLFHEIAQAYEKLDRKSLEKERMHLINRLSEDLVREDAEKLVKNSLEYRLGRISNQTYYLFLRDLAEHTIGDTFSVQFPTLYHYFRVIEQEEILDHHKLLNELEALSTALKTALITSQKEEKLITIETDIHLLRDLLYLELTRTSYKNYLKRKKDISVSILTEELIKQGTSNTIQLSLRAIHEDVLSSVQTAQLYAERFYGFALARDKALVTNALAELKKSGNSQAILISGGFHSDGILQQLREKDISYSVIIPSVQHSPDLTVYNQIMMRQQTSFLAPLSYFSQAALNVGQRLSVQEDMFKRLVLEFQRISNTDQIEPIVQTWASSVPEGKQKLFEELSSALVKVARSTILGFDEELAVDVLFSQDALAAELMVEYLIASGNGNLLSEPILERIPDLSVRILAYEKTGRTNLKGYKDALLERDKITFAQNAFDAYHPLSEIFAYINYLYYTLKGGDVFAKKDFPTLVAWNPLTAQVNAEEFYAHIVALDNQGKLPQEIIIREWGIGNGRYAADFLEKMYDLDQEKGTAYYPRIRYVLGYFSPKMLLDAKRQPYLLNHEAVTRFEVVDATDLSQIEKGTTLLVRFNELYDDLPGNEMIYKDGDRFFRITARLKLADEFSARTKDGKLVGPEEFLSRYWNKGVDALQELDPTFVEQIEWVEEKQPIDMRTFPYGDLVKKWAGNESEGLFPVNIGAMRNLEQACNLLHPSGYLQTFDYGFDDTRYLTQELDSEKVQRPAGQPTVYVNLGLLRILAEERLSSYAKVETQSEYLSSQRNQRIMGRELTGLVRKNSRILPTAKDLEHYSEILDYIGDQEWGFSDAVSSLVSQGFLGKEVKKFMQSRGGQNRFYLDGFTDRNGIDEHLTVLLKEFVVFRLIKRVRGYENIWVTKEDLRRDPILESIGFSEDALDDMVQRIFSLEYRPVKEYSHMKIVPGRKPNGEASSLVENKLIQGRGGIQVGSVIDVKKVDALTDNIIQFLDNLISTAQKRGDTSLKVKILYHNDADGVGSARLLRAFLVQYAAQKNIVIEPEFKVKSIHEEKVEDIYIDRTGIDAVFAVDLYWSHLVPGIDMAIDHHKPDEGVQAHDKSPLLINLAEVGFTGTESKYLPSTVLSAILLDYTLRKKGTADGLHQMNGDLPLDVLIDGAILGDMYYTEDNPPKEGFLVKDRMIAEKLKMLSECGNDGLDLILNAKTAEEINKAYEKIQSTVRKRTNELATVLYMDPFNNDNDVLGMFLGHSDQFLQVNGYSLDISKLIIAACGEMEKKTFAKEEKSKRRVIAIATAGKSRDVLRLSLRYDGDKSFLDLNTILYFLRLLNPEKYAEGGGHPGAVSIRIPREDIAFDDVEALTRLTQQTISEIRHVLWGFKYAARMRIFDAGPFSLEGILSNYPELPPPSSIMGVIRAELDEQHNFEAVDSAA